jgi:hypothetical protein
MTSSNFSRKEFSAIEVMFYIFVLILFRNICQVLNFLNEEKPIGSCNCGYLCSNYSSTRKSFSTENCGICDEEIHEVCLIGSDKHDKNAPKFCPSCLYESENVDSFNQSFWIGPSIKDRFWRTLKTKFRDRIDHLILNSSETSRIHRLEMVSNENWEKQKEKTGN